MEKLSFLLLIFICTGLLGCESKKKPTLTEYQIDFLESQIESSNFRLKIKHEETGSSPVGKQFVKITEVVTEKISLLIHRINTNKEVSNDDISEIINLSKYDQDSVNVNTDLLKNALNEFKKDKNRESIILSLLLFNLDVTESFRETFNNYFYDVDYMKPVVVSKTFTVRKGDDFVGSAILQSKMAAVKFQYEMDDPQTPEGFIELPSYFSSDYNGIVKIKGLDVGMHKIKLRAYHWQNGKKVSFENEFEIEVVD